MRAHRAGRLIEGPALVKTMQELDADGSGEVDFEEFAEWWPQQEAKNSALVAAMNDRWSGALKRAQELRREKQDQTEAQRALEAVAKSHATMMRQVNDAEEKNKLLKQAIVQLKEELQLERRHGKVYDSVSAQAQIAKLQDTGDMYTRKIELEKRRIE